MRFLLLLCFIPGVSFAQSWNAVIKAGGLWNTRSTNPVTNEHSSPLNAMGAAGASCRYGAWEGGLAIGLYRYAFRLKGDFYFGPDTVAGKPAVIEYHNFQNRVPAIVFMPFLNKHFDTGRLAWYAGIAPAYVRFVNHELFDYRIGYKATGGSGYALELRGGCTYRLSEACSVFGEPAVGVINMPGFNGRTNMLYASLAVGLRVSVR